jgi:hypothetical protein
MTRTASALLTAGGVAIVVAAIASGTFMEVIAGGVIAWFGGTFFKEAK